MSREPAPEASSGPAPWLSDAAIEQARRLLLSHELAFGRPLLAGTNGLSPCQAAQELFAATVVVLAHDGADPGGDPGPRLVYANSAALRLWRRPWADMVGMPSRLTAEPAERAERGRLLVRAQRCRAITDYSGIRIDSAGRRFRISGARIWNVPDSTKTQRGQAAAFEHWWWI